MPCYAACATGATTVDNVGEDTLSLGTWQASTATALADMFDAGLIS